MPTEPIPSTFTLPLFPLKLVLFPQGVLSLQVFEARYLDLISACLKTNAPFGVVTLIQGHEVQVAGQVPEFSRIGTLAHITNTEAQDHQTLHVQGHGSQRFTYSNLQRGPNGLWIAADACFLPPDPVAAIPQDLQYCSDTLRQLVTALIMQGKSLIAQPLEFANAGWVANMWAELLPASVQDKLELLATGDPVTRLTQVANLLQNAGIAQPGQP